MYAASSTGVSIRDDGLEVWSGDRLPGDLEPERPRVGHPSLRRNDLIAEEFHLRGYIDKWGRGAPKILDACRKTGQWGVSPTHLRLAR